MVERCELFRPPRSDRNKGTLLDVVPILWQHGALARLAKGEKIDKLLYDGYSTISLGFPTAGGAETAPGAAPPAPAGSGG